MDQFEKKLHNDLNDREEDNMEEQNALISGSQKLFNNSNNEMEMEDDV